MTLSSEPVQVAEAIEELLGAPGGPDPHGVLDPDAADAARMCLAEALNNCIEHGYGGEPGHPIRVDLRPRRQSGRGVELRISDRGRRPAAALFDAESAAAAGFACNETADAPEDRAIPDLPEGGLGWSMIRLLTARIRFETVEGWNTLILETADPEAPR